MRSIPPKNTQPARNAKQCVDLLYLSRISRPLAESIPALHVNPLDVPLALPFNPFPTSQYSLGLFGTFLYKSLI